LLSLIPFALTGCDDAPTCGILVTLGGAVDADVDWSLEGTENCGLGDVSSVDADSSALVFIGRTADSYQQMIVLVDSPVLGVAEFPGQVLFVTPTDLWDSGASACTVVITTYTVEPWSRIDFVEIEGIVDCPAPLAAVGGGPALELTTMGISGHVHNEQRTFENL
jgi:hypothetical protein